MILVCNASFDILYGIWSLMHTFEMRTYTLAINMFGDGLSSIFDTIGRQYANELSEKCEEFQAVN